MQRNDRTGRDAPSREALLRAFRETPPAFVSGVDTTLRRLTSEKEETVVKRKLALAPALVLALVLLASAAVAAALYPKTISRLRDAYGDELAAQVEAYGETAELGQSFTLGEVRYTFADAVWNAGTLYGTIVAEPAGGANALLIAGDVQTSGPVGYNPGENAPEGTKSYAETAEETGAKLLRVQSTPDGVLAGGALTPGDVGISAAVTPDNAVVTTFEMGGAQEAESYQVRISVANWEIAPDGEALEDTRLSAEWDVTVTPEAPDAAAPEDAPAIESTLEIVAPAAYAQNGTLPVYALTARNFMETVDPAWFNASGEQSRDASGGYTVTFSDGATLTVSNEAIFYAGHEGTATFHNADGSAFERPGDDLAGKLAGLASDVYYDEREGRREPEPLRDAIPALTRAEAVEMLDALLERLGVGDAAVVWSYGMDLERIRALNAERDAAIAASGGKGFDDPYDLSAVTEDDGGWLLVCEAQVDGARADESVLAVSAFVNRKGVANLILRSTYAPGEAIETPETLLTAEEALAKAAKAAKKSWIPEMADYLANAGGAELIYAPGKSGELRLVPAWRIEAEDAEDGSTFAVNVSAVDGAVLDAPWM